MINLSAALVAAALIASGGWNFILLWRNDELANKVNEQELKIERLLHELERKNG